MTQADFILSSQTAVAARTELQTMFQALATKNSGANAPSPTYANMWWYETDTNLLKMRNELNTGWINVAYLDQANNLFQILDNTKVVTTSGSQTGLLGDQLTSAWQAGTSTTESLVSPAKVKAAVQSFALLSTGSISASGYITVSGLRILWSSFVSLIDGEQTVTFPTAFPTACLGVIEAGSTDDVGSGGGFTSFYNITRTNFTSNRQDAINGEPTILYLAIGY